MELKLIRATVRDAEQIWNMQLEAFAGLLAKYQDTETNPGSEPLEKVLYRLEQPETYYYLLELDGALVGAIRVVDPMDGCTKKKISPLFVLPAYRNKGIAQEAIRASEALHGNHGWSLETILQERGNCHLYEKMGYHTVGKTIPINDRMTLVVYEKD